MGESKHIKRYSKVSEFVKKDCSKAVIQITLRNTGEDAYRPEVYGASVTFQRTITDAGSSSYLLKVEITHLYYVSKVLINRCTITMVHLHSLIC